MIIAKEGIEDNLHIDRNKILFGSDAIITGKFPFKT